MATTRYAGDRFVGNVGSPNSDAALTGVLDGAYYINTGNLTQYVKRRVGGWAQLAGGGGGGTPGGDDTQVQFNNAGAFGGSTGLTFDGQRLYANNLQISGIIYDSNNSYGEGGMVLTNEGTTGVNWKSIESVLSGVGGSGVANYVARWSDEDTITTGVLVDNGTRVGINVPSPSYTLEIADSSSPTVRIEDTTNNSRLDLRAEDSAVLIRSTSNFPMRFDVNQTERMRIATDGNVGIGTNNPAFKLQVQTPAVPANNAYVVGFDVSRPNSASRGFTVGSNSAADTWTLGAHNADMRLGHTYGTDTGGQPTFYPDLTIKHSDQSAGNVGIGTTDPGGKLESYITSGGEKGLRLNSNFAGGNTVDFIPAIVGVSNAGFSIDLAGTNRLVINSGGNVGVGTNAPLARLMVGDGNRNAGAAVQNQAGYFIGTKSAFADAANKGLWQGQLHIADDSALAAGIGGAITFGATQDNTNGTYLASIEGSRDNGISGQYGASMIFRTRTNGSAVMGEHMVIASDGNVGIGTNDPSTKLHVQGQGTFANNGANIILKNTWSSGNHDILFAGGSASTGGANNTAARIRSLATAPGGAATGDLLFTVNSGDSFVDALYIQEDGNVGIGTTSPAAKLQIVSDGSHDEGAEIFLKHANNNATDIVSTILFGNNVGGVAMIQGGTTGANNTGYISFFTDNAGTSSEKVRIIGDGNVGIGTNAPAGKLEIVGSNGTVTGTPDGDAEELVIRNNDRAGIQILSANNGYGSLIFGSASDINGANIFYAPAATLLTIGTQVAAGEIALRTANGAEAVRIDAGGNVGIAIPDPDEKLEVDGNIKIGSDKFYRMGGDAFQIGADGSSVGMHFHAGGSERMTLLADGNVGIGTTSPSYELHVVGSSYSSVRLGVQALNTSYIATLGGTTNNKLVLTGSTNPFIRFQEGSTDRGYIQWHGAQNSLLFRNQEADNFDFVPHDDTGAVALRLRGSDLDVWGYVYAEEGSSQAHTVGFLDGDGHWAAQHIKDTSWDFRINNSTQMFINNSGSVGIGTNNPGAPLHIYQNSASSLEVLFENDGTGQVGLTLRTDRNSDSNLAGFVYFDANDSGGTNTRYASIESFIVDNTDTTEDGRLTFSTMVAGTDTETMHIMGGSVGIGAAPSAPLDIHTANSSGAALRIISGNKLQFLNAANNTNANIYNSGATNKSELAFQISGSTKVTIDNDGNVGIGTTAPLGKLHVYGGQVRILDSTALPSYGARLVVGRDTAQDIEFHVDDLNCKIVADQDSDSNGNHNFILDRSFAGNGDNNFQIQKGGSSQFLINTDGNVGINNTSPEHRLHVAGDAIISGYLYDSTNSTGVDGYVLTSKEDGPQWKMIEDVLSGVGGNGTATYIPQWIDSDTIGDSVMVQSGSAIGIGTDAPDYTLDVAGDIGVNQYIRHNGDPDTHINFTDDDVNFKVGGVNFLDLTEDTVSEMTVNEGGANLDVRIEGDTDANLFFTDASTDKIGIGTNAPAGKLEIVGSNGTVTGTPDGDAEELVIRNNDRAGIQIFSANNAYGSLIFGSASDANGANIFYAPTDKLLTLGTQVADGQVVLRSANGAEAVRIKADGNVGIGTTNPATKLYVGSGTQSVANLAGIAIGNGASSYSYFSASDQTKQYIAGVDHSITYTKAGNVSNHDHSIVTNNTTRIYILAGGNVGIGGVTNPTGLLQIGNNYTIPGSSYGGNDIYIASTGSHANYDPYVTNTDDFRALITISDATTEGPTKPGLILYNDSTTAGGFSPMLLFAKRETGSSPYKAATAAIYARSPLGTGNSDSWIDGELIFATAGAATQGIRQRMVINKEGLVGIGTNAPSGKLHILQSGTYSSTGVSDAALHIKATHNYPMNIVLDADGSSDDTNRIRFLQAGTTKWQLNVGDDVDFFYYNGSSWLNRFVIEDGGNVGIGTATPDSGLNIARSQTSAHTYTTNHLHLSTTTTSNNGGATTISFATSTVDNYGWSLSAIREATNGNDTRFAFKSHNNSDSGSEVLSVLAEGQVGIGTTDPGTAKLYVRSGASSQTFLTGADELIVEGSDHAGISILAPAAKRAQLYFNSDAFLRWVDNDGVFSIDTSASASKIALGPSGADVGVGTNSPDSKLHVLGDTLKLERTNNAPALKLYNNNASPADDAALGYLQFTGKDNDGTANMVYSEVRGGVQSNTNSAVSGYLSFLTTNNGTAVTEAMRIKADGNVGIGTATPTEQLSIFASVAGSPATSGTGANGNFAIESSNGNSLYFGSYNGSPYGCWLQVSNYADQSLTYPLVLQPNGGNVGIGTDDPADTLSIQVPTSTTKGIFFQDGSTSTYGTKLKYEESTNNFYIEQVENNVQTGILTIKRDDGHVGIGTTDPGVTLDVRGKLSIGSPNASYDLYNNGTTYLNGNVTVDATLSLTGGVAGLSVINSSTTDSAAADSYLNIFKTAGSGGGSRATLRVGYDAANCFQVSRIRNNANIYINSRQSGSEMVFQIADTEQMALSSGQLKFPDNKKIIMGASNDLQIYHDGNNWIDANGAGDLYLRNLNSSGDVIVQAGASGDVYIKVHSGETALKATNNGAVELYYNNTKTFQTTANGVKLSQSAASYLFGGDGEILAGQDSSGYYFATGNSQDVNKPIFIGDNASYIRFKTSDVERVRIDANGNVGIGSTAPTSKLHVYGNNTVSNLPNLAAQFSATGTGGLGIGDENGTDPYLGLLVATDNFHIKTGGNNKRVTVLSGGNVGIGTATPRTNLHVYGTGVDNGLAKIRIGGNTNNTAMLELAETENNSGVMTYGFSMRADGGSGGDSTNDFQIRYHNDSTSGVTGFHMERADGNVGIGTTSNGYKLRVQGNVYISGTLTEASSLAMKENVETFEPSLDIINKIRPVKYDKKTTGKKEIGLIAEELAELFPELVEKDKNGNPSGVNYSRAVTVLLGGFKELYKEVQELKKRI